MAPIRHHARMPAMVLTVVTLASAACAQRPVNSGLPAGDRLHQRQADFLAALSARDLEQTVAHFADDAVLHVANMPPVQGREAIQRFYGNVFRFLSASDPVPELTRVADDADMAYTTGRVTNTFAGPDGPVEHTGKYLLVWERRGGDWAIVVYSISSNQPDPAR